MCTVSFLPNSRGFYVAMNRDEKRDRETARPPSIVDLRSRRAIFPSEQTGGTWIAVNDEAVCVALINWHRAEREPEGSIISRGRIVRKLAGASSIAEIAAALTALPLQKLRPFRLIAIVPGEKKVTEWRWNLKRLSTRKHPWRLRHWFSSGFDEAKAERQRSRACRSARERQNPGDLIWLRRLHRSHSPSRGPFSICMHRPDAATVSYTEVVVQDRQVIMCYKPGSPCSSAGVVTKAL
jgi:hypothetical protein